MAKWTVSQIGDLSGKTMIVTGAASGIGFESAKVIAVHGARALVADKDQGRGRLALSRLIAETGNSNVFFEQVDLSSLDSVFAAAHRISSDHDSVDVLVNNAGIQSLSTRILNDKGLELTFAIGQIGHFALTGALFPHLLKAASPRIVTVSSLVHGQGWFDWNDLNQEQGYSSQRAYNQTKLANILFA